MNKSEVLALYRRVLEKLQEGVLAKNLSGRSLIAVVLGATLGVIFLTGFAPVKTSGDEQPSLLAPSLLADQQQHLEPADLSWRAHLEEMGKELKQTASQRRARLTIEARGPSSAPSVTASGPIADIISAAFASYGPTAVQWGMRVAGCESGLNPMARGGGGAYQGLYQFSPSTFVNNAHRAGFNYTANDVWDPTANAKVASYMYSQGQQHQWGCP